MEGVEGVRMLDAYCGAGIGADGWAKHFTMHGVDLYPQPSYPYIFTQANALVILVQQGPTHDAISASPPCQLFTRAKHLRDAQGGASRFTDLLTPTIGVLRNNRQVRDIPWVVENVPGAQSLMYPREGESLIELCGSMFGLGVQRHRLFLSNRRLRRPGPCMHSQFPIDEESGKPRPWGVYHVPSDSIPAGGRTARDVEHGKEVMGVKAERDVTWEELKEGYPPAYSEWIGSQLL